MPPVIFPVHNVRVCIELQPGSGDVRWLNHYGASGLDVPSLAGGLS